MQKSYWFWVVAILVGISTANAQTLTPVFEWYTTGPVPHFPFIKAEEKGAEIAPYGPAAVGQYEMDQIGDLVRYDQDRLLLMIVENGVNETDPAHNAALAAQFPDRTLWWISPGDGRPIGMALNIGYDPYPDTEDFILANLGTHPRHPSTTDRSWWLKETYPHFTVDSAGNLYVGNKHNLLRYKPNGTGGFSAPELVYAYPLEKPASGGPVGIEDAHWRAWRMWDIHITGSGANLKMTTSARFWINNGECNVYNSADGGKTWTQYTSVYAGGGCSQIARNTELNEEYIYTTHAPGHAGGGNSGQQRHVRSLDAGPTDPFQNDADFWAAQVDPNPAVLGEEKYQAWTSVDIDSCDNSRYVAVYCMPNWQTQNAVGESGKPYVAWLGLLDTTDTIAGGFLDARNLGISNNKNFPGGENVAPNNAAPDPWRWFYQNQVNMYRNPGYGPDGAEILLSTGLGGYGRYVVGNTDVNDWSVY